MGVLADLKHMGAPVEDARSTASYIGGLILTRRQKATLLKDYLGEKGLTLTEDIKRAADPYADQL